MLATLCYYDNWLGPYHPQTLHLMVQVAAAYYQAGLVGHARPLLERAVRDVGRHLGQHHDLRFRAMAVLRDLLTAQGEFERAERLRTEIAWRERRPAIVI